MIAENKDLCCGCFACQSVCPTKAIDSVLVNGFSYPKVDLAKCVNCHRCEKVCPFIVKKTTPALAYHAAKCKDLAIRVTSTSGGVFLGLCEAGLKAGYHICGAGFSEAMMVNHFFAKRSSDCKKFSGAKYVESDLTGIYQKIHDFISRGEKVLFSGCPCQVSAIKNYVAALNLPIENLFLCDVLCHGASSSVVWRDYLSDVGKRSPVISVEFRNKSKGWHSSEIHILLQDGTKICESHAKNPYSQLYFNHYSFRPSCANCPYSSTQRCGDISLGDYWGVENRFPSFDDNKGVSLVLINTPKGEKMFAAIQDGYDSMEIEKEQSLQPVLVRPSSLPPDYSKFWRDYDRLGFEKSYKRYIMRESGLLRRFAKLFKVLKRGRESS